MTFKVKDHYFQKAKKENFLARSIYKLEEIDQRYKIIKNGNHVLDLGYHPGSWIQYTSKQVGPDGRGIGIDIKTVNTKFSHSSNVTLLEMDIDKLDSLEQLGRDRPFDVVLSDMAPNTTGIRSLDQDRSLILVEKVFQLVKNFLRPGGNVVVKVFESGHAQEFLKIQKQQFKEFHFLRPKSTRSVSKEYFVIGKGFLNLKSVE